MTQQYPTEEDIKKIQEWPAEDFHGLMAFVKSLWAFDSWGWSQEGDLYRISTGGWSGNEDIIGALKENTIFWLFYWQQSARGGHYIFAALKTVLNLKAIQHATSHLGAHHDNLSNDVQPTMKLRFVEVEHDADKDVAYAVIYKWGEPRFYKLQQLYSRLGEDGGLWKDVEITYDPETKCWKCESMFTPKAEDLKRWAESGAPFDPTDWECPSCKALEGELPNDHSK